MGTKQGTQNEVGFYHTSDSCVTRGHGRLHGNQSRFLSEFGRMKLSAASYGLFGEGG